MLCLRKYCLLVRAAACLPLRSQQGVNCCLPSLSHHLKSNTAHTKESPDHCVVWTPQSQTDNIWQVFNLLLLQLQCYFHLQWSQIMLWVPIKHLYSSWLLCSGVLNTEPTWELWQNKWETTCVATYGLQFRKTQEKSLLQFFADTFGTKLSMFALSLLQDLLLLTPPSSLIYSTLWTVSAENLQHKWSLKSIPSPWGGLHCRTNIVLHAHTQEFPPSKAQAWLNQIFCNTLWVCQCLPKCTAKSPSFITGWPGCGLIASSHQTVKANWTWLKEIFHFSKRFPRQLLKGLYRTEG